MVCICNDYLFHHGNERQKNLYQHGAPLRLQNRFRFRTSSIIPLSSVGRCGIFALLRRLWH
jgi:hypothetical protein